METEIINDVAVCARHVEEIKNTLPELSPASIGALYEYVFFLREKDRKRKAFEERILAIESESDTLTFETAEEAVAAIESWSE